MLSLFLSDSQGLRLPWFIPPSFLPRALISFNPTNRRTCSWLLARHRHLRVDAASFARHCHHRVSAAFTRWWHCSSPPSDSGSVRGLPCSSLPSPGQCGLATGALHLTLICSSRRPAHGSLCFTQTLTRASSLRLSLSSLSRALSFLSISLTRLLFVFCVLFCVLCFVFVPTHGSSDSLCGCRCRTSSRPCSSQPTGKSGGTLRQVRAAPGPARSS